MGSPRLRGTALKMEVDGVDHWADVISCVMDGEDVEDGYEVPTRESWWFDITAVQSTHRDSFWTFLWENRGERGIPSKVPFTYAPNGNSEPTQDEPHFTGMVGIPGPPPLGGEAGKDVEQTFVTRLPITQGPVRVTGTT